MNTYDTENDEEINILPHSKYYSTTEFGDILKAKAGFRLLNLNIQSVASKFSKLKQYFVDKIEQNRRNPISVIAIQASWLDDSKVDIDNLVFPSGVVLVQCMQLIIFVTLRQCYVRT